MKTVLYYFSSTGNSLAIAKKIASELDAQLYNIAAVISQKDLPPADCVGLIFPVYCWGLPRIVQRFVQNLNIAKSTYIFAIANCGSSIGKTLVQLQQELQSNSYTLSAGFKIKMPGNYTPMYGALATEKQNKLFQAAEQEISKIIPVIKTKKQLPIPTGVFPLAQISNWLYKISLPRFAKLDKDFLVTESCNGCQICEKICPVQNIKMQNHKPTWSGNCEQCLGCLQWCPQTAIEFGKSTLNKKRYHHPQIKITELYSR